MRGDSLFTEGRLQEQQIELTILMPCLNEARTLARCIGKARKFLEDHDISGEILVADNGSTDGSREIALHQGVSVIDVPVRGYGSALRAGIDAARGMYTIMGDADDSYDFSSLSPFLEKLRDGCDLVMGNRFRGGIRPGAMPFLHRYLGNPVLSFIGRLLFGGPVRDFHCGLRGFRTEAIRHLDLRTSGMEFASEMIIRSLLQGLKITEVPTVLSPDGRIARPHLRTWRDGWRHLRLLLLYSPRWIFLYPGLALIVAGAGFGLWLLPSQQYIFDVHTLLYCAVFMVMGLHALSFALLAKAFAMNAGIIPRTSLLRIIYGRYSLEIGLGIGLLLLLSGIGLSLHAFLLWRERDFGPLEPQQMLRIVIPSVTMIFAGMQVVLTSFFLSILQMRGARNGPES